MDFGGDLKTQHEESEKITPEVRLQPLSSTEEQLPLSNQETFVHVEVDSNGKPMIVDGDTYSSEMLLKSLKDTAPKISLSGVERGDFIRKLCSAFGLSTDVVYENLQDVIADAQALVECETISNSLASDQPSVTIGTLDSVNSDENDLHDSEVEDEYEFNTFGD